MSRRIVCTFAALFILISSFALSGANFNLDDFIVEDIPSVEVYFTDIPEKVDSLEANFAVQAVNSQIGHDCYDGYAIYHRVTGDITNYD